MNIPSLRVLNELDAALTDATKWEDATSPELAKNNAKSWRAESHGWKFLVVVQREGDHVWALEGSAVKDMMIVHLTPELAEKAHLQARHYHGR